MRLKLNLENGMFVKDLGKLGILGTAERETNKTEVQFLLVISDNARLGHYLLLLPLPGVQYEAFLPLILEEGVKVMSSLGRGFIVFSRIVEGELRNPRGFLRATAKKLLEGFEELDLENLGPEAHEDLLKLMSAAESADVEAILLDMSLSLEECE